MVRVPSRRSQAIVEEEEEVLEDCCVRGGDCECSEDLNTMSVSIND
jgi:hypothetical protein